MERVVYFGAVSRDSSEGAERDREDEKKNSNGHMIELVTSMGIWGAIPLGTSEEPCRMCLKIVP